MRAIPIALLACFIGTPARTDVPPPPPTPSDITLDLAVRGAQSAQAVCAKMKMQVVVVVVDASEVTRVLLVTDFYTRGWIDQAHNLAHTVIKSGMSSGTYAQTLGRDARILMSTEDRRMLPMPGGVPIRLAGRVVGAVAVAGNDPSAYGNLAGPVEPCAIAGRDVIEAGLR